MDLTPDFFQDLISPTEPQVSVTSIQVTTGAGRGDNYTSMLYRVRADGVTDSNKKWSKSFICKCLPINQARREAFKSEILFRNEVAFYTRALPALLDFQESRGQSVFYEVPKVYLAKSQILVLEDMKEKGFTMTDRKKTLDLQHCEAILRTLGHFHGVSLALKSTSPNIFTSEIVEQISECLFRDEYESWYRDYYKRAGENAKNMISHTLNGSAGLENYLIRFEKFMEAGFFNKMVALIKAMEPLATLCHGDCWTNNFLFQYTDSGCIAQLCMLDFQYARYTSPAVDLVQLLFICTNRALRSNHLNHLLNTYTRALEDSFQLLECTNNPFCGQDEWLDTIVSEVRRCSQIGLGLAVDMIPIRNCDSEQAPDLYINEQTSSENNKIILNSSELCRIEMTDLVTELVDADII